jgi:hypothetical protein
MIVRRFPSLRDDGSCSVAARFSFTDPKAPENLVRFSSEWSVATATNPLQPFEVELFSPPRVDQSTTADLYVVFDARPGSKYWKDFMVMFVLAIRDSDVEVNFVGFYDLVTGRMHPASELTDQD